MTTKQITVEKEISGIDGNKKTVSKSGSVQVVETAEDVLAMLQEDQTSPVAKDASEAETKRIRNRVFNLLNYALDLKERAKLNAALASENVDPAKANEKALEQFNKARAASGKAAIDMDKFQALMAA